MKSRLKTGRPRSELSKQAILSAAFDILVEQGFEKLSIEAVASASGTAKTTIYRWWRNKAELAVEAFFDGTALTLSFPDTGTALGDFSHQILELSEVLRGHTGAAMAAMLRGARTDPDLSVALSEKWLNPRRQWGFNRMTKAASDGELQPGVDIGAALALLYGPIYTPLLFGQSVPDSEMVRKIIAIAARGIFNETG